MSGSGTGGRARGATRTSSAAEQRTGSGGEVDVVDGPTDVGGRAAQKASNKSMMVPGRRGVIHVQRSGLSS